MSDEHFRCGKEVGTTTRITHHYCTLNPKHQGGCVEEEVTTDSEGVIDATLLPEATLATPVGRLHHALQCCLEQLVAYEEKGWLGKAWRTRVGLRGAIVRARDALDEHQE